MEEEIRQEAEIQEAPQDLEFRTDVVSNPWFYDNGPAFGVAASILAVSALAVMMILDPSIVTKLLGIVGAIAYYIYAGRFLYHFIKSRKCVTKSAVLTEDSITVVNGKGTKTFRLEDIVHTSSYSSSTNLCVIVATKDDYMTIICSCGYLLSKDGKFALRPFYALNKRFMEMNANHYNYIKNKKYKKKNPYQIPLYVFEVEYDTPRVGVLIDMLKEKYPLVTPAAEEGDE